MLDRKLLVNALRIDNKDVLPKFGSTELKKLMEEQLRDHMEYFNIDALVNWEDGTIGSNTAYSILDALERGSVGILDSDNQLSLSFLKNGNEIIAHNLFTDIDTVLDPIADSIGEYIIDQLNEECEEVQKDLGKEESVTEAENVLFKLEYNEYLEDYDVLAVFVDCIEQAGDEGKILVYRHVGQHDYADPAYIEELSDAAPSQYEPLKQELESSGYVLNILNDQNEMQEDSAEEVPSMVIRSFDWTRALDDYEEGEQDSTAVDFNVLQKEIEVSSIVEAKDYIATFAEEYTGIPDLANYLKETEGIIYEQEDSRFCCSFPTTKDDVLPTDEELARWKKGYISIYANIFIVNVETDLTEAVSESSFKNYGVCIAQDLGNEYEVLEIRDNYEDFDAAQRAINDLETSQEFDDPTMMAFVVYSDGISWFNAVTGDEIEYEVNEAINEDISESFEVLEDVLEMCKDLPEHLREKIIYTRSGKISSKQELHSLMMDVRDAVEGRVPSSMAHRLDDAIDNLYDELSEASEKFKDLKDARRAIAHAKRLLQKKLDKGDFYENFGQKEVQELRDKIPTYAEDMDQSEFNSIKKAVADFNEWCMNATPSSKNEDYSIDSALEHLDDEIKSAKAVLDKIQQRVVYRMKDNVSYSGDEAIDKVHQVADKISQDSLALNELVYNDIIG